MNKQSTLSAFTLAILMVLLLAGCDLSSEGNAGVERIENASPAGTRPDYQEIVALGLMDSEHTSSDGYSWSGATRLNEQGQVAGTSIRYNSASGGELPATLNSAWFYDGVNTIRIGLMDGEADDDQSSSVDDLNDQGYVVGSSDFETPIQIDPFTYLYIDPITWLYDGASSRQLDFDGYYDAPIILNNNGQVAGTRAVNDNDVIEARLYDGASMIRIGLYDDDHKQHGRYMHSRPEALNERGQVVGTSLRRITEIEGAVPDQSAWLYDGSRTVRIGLTDSEHTRSDGAQWSGGLDRSLSDSRWSRELLLNEQGQVAGVSDRFLGGGGQSAWLYDGSSTVRVGLYDDAHTVSDSDGALYNFGGAQFSRVSALNAQGQVAGVSRRYRAAGDEDTGDPLVYFIGTGQSAWLHDGDKTIRLGLTDSEHTAIDGRQASSITALNEQGLVAGASVRFVGGGNSAWLYDGNRSIRLGFTGGAHTRSDGYQSSSAFHRNELGALGEFAGNFLNDLGQVAGFSSCFVDASMTSWSDCRTLWLYDSASDQLFDLTLSTRNDGLAYGTIYYLGNDGLVLGSYTLFDEDGTDLGSRAFYFTIEEGLHDLGTLAEESGLVLADHGWKQLTVAQGSNARRQIVGRGELLNGGSAPFLLTPAR